MSEHQILTALGTIGAMTLLAAAVAEQRAFERSGLRVQAITALSSLLGAVGSAAGKWSWR